MFSKKIKYLLLSIFVIAFLSLFFVNKTGEKSIPQKLEVPPKQYSTIIFDIGGVLLSEPYNKAFIVTTLKKFTSSLFSGNFIATIKNYKQEISCLYSPELSETWSSICKGTSEQESADQAIEKVKIILGKEQLDAITKKDILLFHENVRKYTKMIPKGIQILKDVKAKGYKTYLLSNIGKEDHEYYLQQEDLSEIFKITDGGIMSYKVKRAKPDPEIYKILLKTYGLKPEECLFIDNKQLMIDGAKAVGIDGIVCLDHDEVLEDLKRLGVL